MWACSHSNQIVPLIAISPASPGSIAKPSVAGVEKLRMGWPWRPPAANVVVVAGDPPPKQRAGTDIPAPGPCGAAHGRRSDGRPALAQLSAGRYSTTVVGAGLSGP